MVTLLNHQRRHRMTAYGVLGRGSTTPEAVITAGLQDSINTGKDTIHLPWYGKPIPTDLEFVYDWVLDNELTFVLYAPDAQDVPKAFHKCSFGTVVEGDPVAEVAKQCTTLLYLWDDDHETLERTINHPKAPSLILDLTAGLIPIEFESVEEAIAEEPSSKYDDDDDDDERPQDMTRDELEIMPALAVKRYASARLGVPFATKGAAIDALFPPHDDEEEDPTDDAVAVDQVSPSESDLSSLFSELEHRVASLPASPYRDQALFRIYEAKMWFQNATSVEE
jgi:hypothetical protein